MIQCKGTDSVTIMNKLKVNLKNENLGMMISLTENEYMDVLLSSVKLNFNGKPSILVGLSDISKLKKESELLKERAIFDELTGLYNRHFLDEKMDEAIERSDRYNEPLSILIMDLDHFKRVNDTWGHPMGDEVLKQTAQIAKANIRKLDIPVRFGGEEFLIVLPHTDIMGAFETAEQIRRALEVNTHTIVGKYTASFGVAEKRVDESFNSLYKRVDEALYLAKESGRNRVVSAESQENLPIASVRFVWRNEWESGDQGVDDQHRELLEIANSFIFMSLSNDKFDKTLEQLEIFIEHLVNHYIYEENYFIGGEYPDHQDHVDVHNSLMEKLLELKLSYQNKELKASALFSFILDEVIVGHIIEADTLFFQYFNDNPPKIS